MSQDAINEDPRYYIVDVGIGVLTVAQAYITGLEPIQRAVLATALYRSEPIGKVSEVPSDWPDRSRTVAA